jgi:hemolysin activation/secretion protein
MASTTFTGAVTSKNGFIAGHQVTTANAINATATATAAQVATGYITSTSAAPTSITLPTGTLLGAALNAVQGTTFDLLIDNTAGASTVTIVVAVNGILSTAAADTVGSFGDLTVAAGVTGLGRYTIMFSSATAYVFTRTA